MLFDLCGRKAEPKYDRDEEFALSLFLFCFGKKRREKRTREEGEIWVARWQGEPVGKTGRTDEQLVNSCWLFSPPDFFFQ